MPPAPLTSGTQPPPPSVSVLMPPPVSMHRCLHPPPPSVSVLRPPVSRTLLRHVPPSVSVPRLPVLRTLLHQVPPVSVCRRFQCPGPSYVTCPCAAGLTRRRRYRQAMLAQLFLKGPYTVGIFRKSANARMVREIRVKLDSGVHVSGADVCRSEADRAEDEYRLADYSSLESQRYGLWQ